MMGNWQWDKWLIASIYDDDWVYEVDKLFNGMVDLLSLTTSHVISQVLPIANFWHIASKTWTWVQTWWKSWVDELDETVW